MMSDVSLPWLSLTSSLDPDANHVSAEEQAMVTNALKDMTLGSQVVSPDVTVNESGSNNGKQKRTSSHGSPPKVCYPVLIFCMII
jgi:hypothetical protein